MREIKFRAWDKDKHVMLFSDFILVPTTPGWGATQPFTPKSFEGNRRWFDCQVFDWADADLIGGTLQVMESTGLKDKNGKEIYEGDILQPTDPNGDTMQPMLVEWDKRAATYAFEAEFDEFDVTSLGWAMQMEYEFEILGNQFENPDLLKAVRP